MELEEQIFKSMTLRERLNFIECYKKEDSNEAIDNWLKNENNLSYSDMLEKLKIQGIEINDFKVIINNNYVIDEKDKKKLGEVMWVKQFKEILSSFNSQKQNILSDEKSLNYCLNIFIQYIEMKLEQFIEKLDNIDILNSVKYNIINGIINNLSNIYIKTVIYEFYNQGKDNFFEFNKFNFNDKNKIKEFYFKYPVMTRRLLAKIDYQIDFYLEFLKNLNEDYKEIKQSYNIKDSILTEISIGLGDTHEKGKSVIKFKLGKTTAIYKPKNLKIGAHYNNILCWFNNNFDLEKFPTIKRIYRENYTFEEYIDSKSCDNVNEIKRFYLRFGYILGLNYILLGNDFHKENIIAKGEFPYIIDIETLFQHNIKIKGSEYALNKANLENSNSIRNMSLLPNKLSEIDISALMHKREKYPKKVLSLSGSLKKPCFEFINVYNELDNNIPRLNGQKQSYKLFKDEIIKGFTDILEIIKDNKEEFLNRVLSLGNCKVRQLIRNTKDYYEMLTYASHPKYTTNMLNLEKMFDNCWTYGYEDKRVIASEIRDLLDDDIPSFYKNIDSLNVIDSREKEIDRYYDKSSISYFKDMINRLDDAFIAKQIDFILIDLGNAENFMLEKLRRIKDSVKFSQSNNIEFDLKDIANNLFSEIQKFRIGGKYSSSWFGLKEHNLNSLNLSTNELTGIMYVNYLLYTLFKDNNIAESLKSIENGLTEMPYLYITPMDDDKLNNIMDFLMMLSLIKIKNPYLVKIQNIFLETLSKKNEENSFSSDNLIKYLDLMIMYYNESFNINYLNELRVIEVNIINNINDSTLILGDINYNYAYPSIIQLLEIASNTDGILNLANSNNGLIMKNLTSLDFEEIKQEDLRNIVKFLKGNIDLNKENNNSIKKILINLSRLKYSDSTYNILDLLIYYNEKYKDKDIQLQIDKIKLEIIKYNFSTKETYTKSLNFYKDLSMTSGLTGLIYILLREEYKIKSIINII